MSGHYERLGSSLSRLEPCDQIDAMNKRASAKTAVAKPRRRTNTVARSKQTFDNGQPRYLQIARELKRGIANGAYPVGARLPTELELCEQFTISRFTARAAIRVLSSAGLVTRRQRVGTVVIAKPDDARYSHDAASLRDLQQYAQDTELRLMYIGKATLGRTQARELGARAGEEWIYAIGTRHGTKSNGNGDRPFCLTRLYLNPTLKGIEARLRERKSAVYALIEREYKIQIERVEQDFQAVVLSTDDAANLGAQAGAPALRIVRRYYGDDGRLLEVADNIHPSDRFTYRMQLRK
ncbi:MAG TPA: GntR family transcriptional regulator [Mesorhizobium sp.]|nr:GntR family transcriptional regulator [Mesorhizobium sp.]